MKRTVIRVLYLGLMIAFIFFTGCMHQSQNGTHVKLIIDRFEEDLFGISVYHLKDSIGILQQKYPDFFPLFTAEVLEITDTSKEIITEGVISFTTDFTIYRVSNHVREIFPSLEGYETGLAEAF